MRGQIQSDSLFGVPPVLRGGLLVSVKPQMPDTWQEGSSAWIGKSRGKKQAIGMFRHQFWQRNAPPLHKQAKKMSKTSRKVQRFNLFPTRGKFRPAPSHIFKFSPNWREMYIKRVNIGKRAKRQLTETIDDARRQENEEGTLIWQEKLCKEEPNLSWNQ